MIVTDLRNALERLVALAPTRRGDFNDELWRRIRASERSAAHRWRAVALGAIAAAIAAGSAVGVLAMGRASGGTIIDRTVSCRLPTALGGTRFAFGGRVDEPTVQQNGKTYPQPGGIGVSNGFQPEHTYVAASKLIYSGTPTRVEKDGYLFDTDYCRSTQPIPFTHAGLASLGVFSRAGNAELERQCFVGASPVTIRLRVTLAKAGTPVSAQLAIRAGKTQHSVAFVDWTPTRFTAFASSSCRAP